MEGFRRADPIPVPELAVPVAVAEWFGRYGWSATLPSEQAKGDLGVIAFFFLLRVGEYTTLRTKGMRRTKQFRAKDVSFFRDGEMLDPRAPLEVLESATGATMKLTNQKNGVQGSCVHHHTINNRELCPVRALARRVHHIYANKGSGEDMLCTFADHVGKGVVTDQDMGKVIKVAVVDLKLEAKGFPATRVGTHSLRAGGAVALALSGQSPEMIKKIGRWSSDTFLMYVHEQIAHLTAGVAEGMAQPFPFLTSKGPQRWGSNKREPANDPTEEQEGRTIGRHCTNSGSGRSQSVGR